jgi:UDP-glucose 4-epimerase
VQADTFLVTGAAGFIGRHICAHLESRGIPVVRVVRPHRDQPTANPSQFTHEIELPSPKLAEILAYHLPSVVLHCAGTSSVQESLKYPERDYRANVTVTESVLEALRRYSPKTRLVFLSSAAVYGNPTQLPIRETAAIRPVSPYGVHKAASELLCRYYARVHQVPSLILRIFSTYGPGLARQVLWDSLRSWQNTGDIFLNGTGCETRDFVHVSDLVAAITLAVDRARFSGNALNVASGQSVTVAAVAGILLAKLGRGTVQFAGTARPGDPKHWEADVTRLRRLGFKPNVELAQGLGNYVEWAMRELG